MKILNSSGHICSRGLEGIDIQFQIVNGKKYNQYGQTNEGTQFNCDLGIMLQRECLYPNGY